MASHLTRFRHLAIAIVLALECGVFCLRAELLVASFNQDAVYRFNETNGAFVDVFVAPGSGTLDLPHDMTFAPDGHLLVASAGNDCVLKYDGTNGAFLGVFVQTNSGGLNYPVSLQYGPDGHLHVSSQLSSEVLRYDGTNGTFLGAFVSAGSGGLNGPSGMEFGPDGNLWVVARFGNQVLRYHGTNGAYLDTPIASGLSQPFGLRFGTNGNLFVASGNDNAVQRFDGTNLTTFASGGAISFPVGVEFAADGTLLVCSFSGSRVTRFNPDTGASLGNFVATGSGGINGPNFLRFRPENAIQAPVVTITRTNGNVHLSWITASTNFVLQSTTNLSVGAWSNMTATPIVVTNLYTVTDSDAGTNRFYRLRNASGRGP